MKVHLSKHNIIGAILFLSFVLILAGCKSKKVSVVDGSGNLKAKSHNEVVSDILNKELNYKTITSKGKVSLNGKGFTTVFKLVKDEFIQASVRPFLGIEAARMDISPERIVIIDRLGARYSEIDLKSSDASLLIAFNFYNLQALLTNQLFLAGNNGVKKSDFQEFKLLEADNNFVLQSQDRNKLLYNFIIDPTDRIVNTVISNANKSITLDWKYSDFVQDQEHIYPTTMTANVNMDKKKIKLGVSYSNLDINTDFSLDKTIPSKYKKVNISDLLSTYIKLK